MPLTEAHILLVDTDLSDLKRVGEYLLSENYTVSSECSGSAALLALDSIDPDIVLCDLDLGEISGFDLLEAAKKKACSIPVVFISADGGVRDVIEALRKGAINYILKPLDKLSVLTKVIDEALSRSKMTSDLANGRKAMEALNLELRSTVHELERDQTAGRLVQQNMAPPATVSLAGIDLSYKIIPSLYLSGDSIDYGLLNGRYLAFYLTDISGHGSASAFVAVWVKQLVRGYFRELSLFNSEQAFETDAPRLMALINQELLKANIGPHLTCFVGVIDTQTLLMNYVVGGHLPLPLLQTDKGLQALEGTGKPLGLFDSAKWRLNKIQLPESFQLMVFSDGVLEVLPVSGLNEQEAYLSKTIANSCPDSLEALDSALNLRKLDNVPDDVAMLLISK